MKEINEQENQIGHTKNYNKLFIIMSILNFFAIIFSIVFLIAFMFLPNSFQGNNINEYSNDYCRNQTNEYYDLLCTNKYYNYNIKKSKFIWILTDGTASDQTVLLNNFEKYKIASPFLVEGYDITYKQTNEMHETLITGKHNRNYVGKEINYDNIIQQLVDAGYKINYRGWELPIPNIIGDKKNGIKENKIFNKKFIDNDHEVTAFSSFCNITNPFPFIKMSYDKYQNTTPNDIVNEQLLNKTKNIIKNKNKYLYDKQSKIELYKELDELFEKNPIDLLNINIDYCLEKSFDWNNKENISILYYTTEVDQFNHLLGKTHIYNVLQMYITEKMIIKLMDWVDNHTDYALIVSSDHGGQEFYGEDSLRTHGEDFPGNEAIFFVYTKELKDHFDELKMEERYIKMIDENEIIAQMLLNVNIPINSRGFPFKVINDDRNAFISLKMKEIQLMQLIEKYIKKYNKYENSLKDILNELKSNFSSINSIIKEYITQNIDNNSTKRNAFKNLVKINEQSLYLAQEKILEIIDKKNKTAGNIVLFIFIFIFIVIKILLEIFFLFFRLIDKNAAELHVPRKRRWFLLNVFLFIFFYIFYFYCSIPGNNIRSGVTVYCFCIGYYYSIILAHYIFNFLRLNWNKNKIIIILLIGSIFFFTVFCQIINYSDCFYYLKKNLSYFYDFEKILVNLFSFFLFLFILMMIEYKKLQEKNYFIFFCKKRIPLEIILVIYFFLLITIFIEDSTKKDYYEQNKVNRVFVCINFIFFIIYWILSHFVVYEKKGSEPVNININNNNDDKFNEEKILKQSNNIDNIGSSKGQPINQNEINSSQNVIVNFEKSKVNGLPCIKLFLFLLFFWISDEGKKFFGFIILIPFLEILDYLSNYFNKQINEIIFKTNNSNNLDETKPEEISNSINVSERVNKNKNKSSNYYLFYFLFYLIIQDMFLVANQSSFALLKNSFGLDTDRNQKAKGLYVFKSLGVILGAISKYSFTLIILAFFLDKGFYDKNYNGFSMNFLIRKILLSLRIDMDIIFYFYEMLINVNDKLFIDLFIYFFVNISLLILDYLGFGLTLLGMKLCR